MEKRTDHLLSCWKNGQAAADPSFVRPENGLPDKLSYHGRPLCFLFLFTGFISQAQTAPDLL